MKAVTVCVDYSHILKATLAINAKHFEHITVLTSSADHTTQDVCSNYSNVTCVVTDSFYHKKAYFNKYRAIEEHFEATGRDGWICLLDADTVLPGCFSDFVPEVGKLYVPMRRMCPETNYIPHEPYWRSYPQCTLTRIFSGYCQIFHAEDPVLSVPWFEINWKHAGGADSTFQRRWSDCNKVRPDFEVLHLGEAGINWCGVSSHARNQLDRLRRMRRGSGPNRYRNERYQ